MAKINVLVFPAEGQNAYELHDALSTCVNIKLYGATSVIRHGLYLFENYITGVPFISNDKFINAFNRILDDNHIDIIFPTHDTVAKYLVDNATDIHAKILSGDRYTVGICRSKIKTYELFKDTDIVPKRYYSSEEVVFPAFAKPDEGQGGKGAIKLTDASIAADVDYSSYLVTDYLPGEETTVDCLTDNKGNLRYVSPRSRKRLLGGISVCGETENLSSEIKRMAELINSRLHFLGLWYFQVKKGTDGRDYLMEVAARCAGTMCQTRGKGINLPLLSIYTGMGYEIDVFDNGNVVKMDRALIGRYDLGIHYNFVYIDFDDTITLRGKVNLTTVRFLYQCHNQGKKIILLTRHEYDLDETLDHYAISKLLFDEIIHISDVNEIKSKYIKHHDSIFIDNAFKDRKEVRDALHIPVFDVDQIEFLLDWRC